ncbi:hypothetical protein [Bradyrhizobium sp. JYMT SZCCT0428]|uniref:hypothetical protein n=1 Tax=Bradyrhizobium sp. JYMT SZCCT0428 TaxID=2807673 RepID=UPI001BAB842A|nr:hypothetical protein [Bradyrhizobium sp. JYMT SZCCT0428]MBR1153696.1 hypothetical protein [Bradyrhizobium sp. JYMT SZCCT0428]
MAASFIDPASAARMPSAWQSSLWGADRQPRDRSELVRQVKAAYPARPIPKFDRPVCNNSLGALDRLGFIGAVKLDRTDDTTLERQYEGQVAGW